MSLLRIYCSLRATPQQCQWALISDGREPVVGEGPLSQLPQRADRVQLVLPAEEVLITRVRLPQSARRHAGSVLAFAVEDEIVGEPDANQVSWLGSAADADVLAVVDKQGLKHWHDALDASGVRGYEVHCETLLLPWKTGEWSLAWNGREGFVRTGEFEGTTTDCGDQSSPPLSLRMMLDEAKSRGEAPASIVVYATVPDLPPEIEAWQRALGVALRLAGHWDWRSAPPDAGVSLAQERPRWRLRLLPGTLGQLRLAGWVVGIALAIHAVALVGDWARLTGEQRRLRQQMEQRFRAAFPETVAVVDPGLQMRRKLAEARHAVGQSDGGDFLPMIAKVATALKGVPADALRVASYEGGRMTLELAAVEEVTMRHIVAHLLQAGMRADVSAPSTRAGRATVILTVHSS